MSGTVTDPSGAVVPGSIITVTNLDTGQVRTAVTGQDGLYTVTDLVIGHYKVAGGAKGFKSYEKTGLVVNVGDRLRVDMQLIVGGEQLTVKVEADQIRIQTETGEVSNLINAADVQKLETNGRSIYTLVNLTPGASSLQADYQAPTPVGGDGSVSFNGQRMSHNLYLLDGGEDLDRGGAGTFSVMPSLEAIGEFRVLSSNYSAEYGLSSAATMTSVIKSGSKSYHGSAWEFVRNDAMDAKNYFVPKTELRSNIFGFNFSGPASLHPKGSPKTFFFYNQEWRRLIQGGSLNQTVPPSGEYSGSFTTLVPGASAPHVPCANQLSAAQQARFTAAGITTFSTPGSDGACSVNTSQTTAPVFVAFPNNQIPSVLLDTNAQLLLNTAKIFPGATDLSTSQFKGGNNAPTDLTEEIVRVDHRFGDKFSIFGHWISEQISQDYGTTMWSGDNVPTIQNTFGNPSYSGVVHSTYTISPNILNEMAFNYNGNRIHMTPKAGYGASLSAPSDFQFNRIFTGPNADNRNPSIQLSGKTGADYTANYLPWSNKADDYQVRDDLSWVKGAHQLKFGASWALYKKVQNAFASTEGSFQFNGFYTGNDMADFVLGYSNNYSEDAVEDSGHWNNVSWALYAQDDWHANKRLTLNLGLRWDGVPHTYEVNHRASNFYPSRYNTANTATFDSNGYICSGASDSGCTAVSPGLGTSPNAILAGYQFYLNGVGIDGQNGVPKGLVNNHWATFGPRIGFAYDLTGAGKTVFRGGIGMMYERIQGNDMYDGATNVPFDVTATFSNVLLANPKTSVATNITQAVPIVVPSITGLDIDNYKLPVSYQYSVGVQQQLASNTLLSVSYVGNQTRHQNDYRETNLPPAASLAGLVNSGGSGYNTMLPYLGFRSIKQAENEANGHYNSMQVDFHTVIHKALQAQIGYTFSRAIDPTTGGGNGFDLDPVSNPYEGWRYDSGSSIFDRTSVFFTNYIYELPFFRTSESHMLRTLMGGWELAGIVTAESGAPLNIVLGGSASSNGVQNGTNRPNLVGKISYPKQKNATGVQWFDTTAFSDPTVGDWGNLGHDALRGPGRDNWNLALHKIFAFTEHSNFEFRAESFNVWNHTQLKADVNNGGIGNSVHGNNFGIITSAWDPRTFQMAAKISF
jgi:hypothetical protein